MLLSSLTKKIKSVIKAHKGPVIGIDLGTTKSRVAVLEGNVPKVLENKEIPRETPSCVTVTKKDSHVKHQRIINPENTLFSTRRLMTEWFDDYENEIFKDEEKLRTIETQLRNPARKVRRQFETSGELVAHILITLKTRAESYLMTPVHSAVISVPEFRLETESLITLAMAGFENLTIISQPKVLAPAYAFNICNDKPIAICDFGGGKFETSIYKVTKDGKIEINSVCSRHLGGDNFDLALMNYFKESFMKQTGINLSSDAVAMCRLREVAVDAKIQLSQATEVEINIPGLAVNSAGRYTDFNAKLTRKQFENLVYDMLLEAISLCRRSVEFAEINQKDLNEVLLIGGMTEMPKIRKMVGEFFEQSPSYRMDPDESVVIGALLSDKHNLDLINSKTGYW